MALVSADRDHAAVRRGLVVGITLSTLLVGYGLVRYPANLNHSPASLIFGVLLIVLLVGYGVIAFRWMQTRTAAASVALRQGVLWGLRFGTLWLVEVLASNLGFAAATIWTRLAYSGAVLAILVLTLCAGAFAALRSGRIVAGAVVGFWSGLISGQIAFMALLVVSYLFIGILLHDPQNIREFQDDGAPDLATSIVGESLAGGINHLWLGPLVGVSLGALGGVVGAGLASERGRA